jgi:hypothetical protein
MTLEQVAILHLSTLVQNQEREILRLRDGHARLGERLALLESRVAQETRNAQGGRRG